MRARMTRVLLALTLFTACTTGPDDVVGPFTGTPRRYVVDSIMVPLTNAEARELGADLTGDRVIDNQLGQTIATMSQYGDITAYGDDMIASGALASTVLIQANDYWDDPTVSVTYYGSDGAPATLVGGTFDESVFVSNRTATTEVPGAVLARLPIFVDVDPSEVPLFGVQMTLVPDGTGFIAKISGAIEADDALRRAYSALVDVIVAEPDRHRTMLSILDANHDYEVDYSEVETNVLMKSLFAPELRVDGRAALGFGFHAHLSPCEEGSCISAPPDNTCFDRVKDGDESDVDCGGSCRSCKQDEACTSATDCQSASCDAGSCRASSCSDGVRDGFETDVDCGGPCDRCAIGARCYLSEDCGAAAECDKCSPVTNNCTEYGVCRSL
jgi:hypothetical protein